MVPRTITWKQKDAAMTVLPERGRVLQVSSSDHEAFWANPEWDGGWNAGGDRLWLSPEADWFWGTRAGPDFDHYAVPEPIDPGSWEMETERPGFLRVRQMVAVQHLHRDTTLRCEVARSFAIVEPPDDIGLRNAIGYQTDNELRIMEGEAGQAVGLWSLLQVPNGGEMVVACRGEPGYRIHFGALPRSLRTVGPRDLRLQITGAHRYKIGLQSDMVAGRVAYARPVDQDYLVIYRRFFPQRWRAYCDHPLDALDTPGDAVQVYNDSGELGGFGEMEYHSPGVVAGAGPDRLTDTTLTVVGLMDANGWGDWQERWVLSE